MKESEIKRAYVVEINGNNYKVEFKEDENKVIINDEELPFDISLETAPNQYSVLLNHQSSLVTFNPEIEIGKYTIQSEGFEYETEVLSENESYLRNFIKASGTGKKAGLVKAPMPGKIIQVDYEPGSEIDQGVGVIIMEAMKMENEIKAPVSGILKKIQVEIGTAVEKGQVLFEIE